MASSRTLTYAALIKPIPPTLNLSNIGAAIPISPCEFCTSIVPDRSKVRAQNGVIKCDYSRVDIYPDFPLLKAGCGLCKFLRKTIRRSWATRPMEDRNLGAIREKDGHWSELLGETWDGKIKISHVTLTAAKNDFDSDRTLVTLALDIGPATTLLKTDGTPRYNEISQTLQFHVFDSKDLKATATDFTRRLPSESTLSLENLSMISKWVNECKLHHPKCRYRISGWVPSRLLEVTSLDGRESIRLLETSSLNIQEPYTALSHMWGDATGLPPLKTLNSNYGYMLSGVEASKLSNNFVNAIEVTRRLGLRFLWIDSLCIIQDNVADWAHEAVTMHMVYKNAEFTIAATAAKSSHDGFLKRNIQMIPAQKIGYSSEGCEPNNGYMIICAQDESEPNNWPDDVEGSSWNTRGWIMQERSLSTRTLHFCSQKIYFECRTCRRSEEGEPIGPALSYALWPRNEDSSNSLSSSSNSDIMPIYWNPNQTLYERWISSVTKYSRRELTRKSDKLIAIRSIAAEMELSIKDTYIKFAGMWKNNLKHELLWQVEGVNAKILDQYCAPSWSWASLDTRLSWHVRPTRHHLGHELLSGIPFEVLGVIEGELAVYPTPYYLKIKGWTVDISFLQECDYDDRWVYSSRSNTPHSLYTSTNLDGLGLDTNRFPPYGFPEQEGKNRLFVGFADGSLDLDDHHLPGQFSRSFCYFHINSATCPSGLILEILRKDPMVCERVGVATLFDYENNDELLTEHMTNGKQIADAIFGNQEAVEVLII